MTRVLCSHSRLLWSCPCLAHTRCSFVSHLWKTFLLKSFPPNHAVLCVSCIYIACFVQNLTKWTCAGRSRASKSWSKRSGSTLATKWQTGGWLTKSLRSICFKNFTFWIARCGQGLGSTDTNERSPIFLQWLDCVHQVNTVVNCHPMMNVTTSPIFSTNVVLQLLLQFPCHFEFNLTFLVKLAEHTYRWRSNRHLQIILIPNIIYSYIYNIETILKLTFSVQQSLWYIPHQQLVGTTANES